jgi:4-hydroxybenzoate polyprenyltransferase
VAAFYLGTMALAFAAGVLGRLGPGFEILLIPFAVHLGLQARRVDVTDGRLALKLFKSNAWAGLILFAALAAGVL